MPKFQRHCCDNDTRLPTEWEHEPHQSGEKKRCRSDSINAIIKMSRVLISRQAITVVEIRSQATTVSSNPNTTGSTILFVSAQWSRTPDGRPLTEMTFKASKNVHHHTFKSKSNCNLINSPFLSEIKTCSKKGENSTRKTTDNFQQ